MLCVCVLLRRSQRGRPIPLVRNSDRPEDAVFEDLMWSDPVVPGWDCTLPALVP